MVRGVEYCVRSENVLLYSDSMNRNRRGIFRSGAPTTRQKVALLLMLTVLLAAGIFVAEPWKAFGGKPSVSPSIAASESARTPAKPVRPPEPPLVTGRPNLIELPELGLRHTVIDGSYTAATGEWTLSDSDVIFASQTAQPNNKNGNTFIYGHATNHVFGPILQLQPGQTAKVTTDNGYVFTYRLLSSEVVDPADTAVLRYQGAPRLTLQTCTGPTLSEYRHLFYFDLVGYDRLPSAAVPNGAAPTVSVR